jgi:hypothetical protein
MLNPVIRGSILLAKLAITAAALYRATRLTYCLASHIDRRLGVREAAMDGPFRSLAPIPIDGSTASFLFGLSGPVAGAVIELVVPFIRRSSVKRNGNARRIPRHR